MRAMPAVSCPLSIDTATRFRGRFGSPRVAGISVGGDRIPSCLDPRSVTIFVHNRHTIDTGHSGTDAFRIRTAASLNASFVRVRGVI